MQCKLQERMLAGICRMGRLLTGLWFVFGIVMVVTMGMKVQNQMYDAKLNNLLTEKVNSRFEAKGLLVKLHVEVHAGMFFGRNRYIVHCLYECTSKRI